MVLAPQQQRETLSVGKGVAPTFQVVSIILISSRRLDDK